ncbi:MAG: TetR/AcrR family transcriptional regulator, partial [Acidimicrobiia bacterium]
MNSVQSDTAPLQVRSLFLSEVATRKKREVKPASERKKEIMDAAVALFAEKGFNETTVGDIAAEAGVATGTVYLYFPSKDHILVALHQRMGEAMLGHITEVVGDLFERRSAGEEVDYKQGVNLVIDASVRLLRDNLDLCTVVFQFAPASKMAQEILKAEDEFVQGLGRLLQAGVSQGLIHTEDPEMTAYIVERTIDPLQAALAYGVPDDLDRLVSA